MSPVLHSRRCVVTVDTLRVSGLRTAFKVKKTASKDPNCLELSVTNLSDATRAAMRKTGARVILEAGYTETLGTIFTGDARTIDHVRQGADWVTKITGGDGEVAYQNSRVSESFAPGTTVADVLRFYAKKMGINVGNALDKASSLRTPLSQFQSGFATMGKTSAELDKLLRSLGLTWSIQDGALQVLAHNEVLDRNQAVVLSPRTGMIGSPEHGHAIAARGAPLDPEQAAEEQSLGQQQPKKVLKVKSLLQPVLKPGVRVQIQSEGTHGFFRANAVEHTGDTGGGDWYSEVELAALS
jgi:hypothetical protein